MATIKRVVPLLFDLGNLAGFDINPVDETALGYQEGSEQREAYLQTLTRENAQLLIERLFQQPTEDTEDGLVVMLPSPTTPLPRAKPIPKVKELTRWEQFARFKGIRKTKRSSHIFDEATGEWRPRYGRKSAKNDPMVNWVEELKPGQDIADLD